ncbi:sigma-70 family RNA polymerase sigma factor [Aeoliella sp.]|uniref:sigma-70 family RNA polymerase sigma factor n=1 Tax=Aeoliella sp. TaxID=2795800 RepID=UPI003CCBDBAD
MSAELEEGGFPEATSTSQDELVRLLAKHSNAIWGFILALTGNRHDTDDIFQETNVILVRKFREFKPGTDFLAWACTVARYQTQAFRNRHSREGMYEPELVEALSQEAMIAARSADQRRDALLDCLQRLRSPEKELINLRYYESSPVREIAAAQGISKDKVYRALAMIHKSLQACIHRKLGIGAAP